MQKLAGKMSKKLVPLEADLHFECNFSCISTAKINHCISTYICTKCTITFEWILPIVSFARNAFGAFLLAFCLAIVAGSVQIWSKQRNASGDKVCWPPRRLVFGSCEKRTFMQNAHRKSNNAAKNVETLLIMEQQGFRDLHPKSKLFVQQTLPSKKGRRCSRKLDVCENVEGDIKNLITAGMSAGYRKKNFGSHPADRCRTL